MAPKIDYTARDYDTIMAALKANIAAQFPNDWTDLSESNIGVALLGAIAYVGDILSFYADVTANEMYPDTARDRESMLRLNRWFRQATKLPSSPGIESERIFSGKPWMGLRLSG